MDRLKLVNTISLLVMMVCVTIGLIIVILTLPGPKDNDVNSLCLNVNGELECQNSLSTFMSKALKRHVLTLEEQRIQVVDDNSHATRSFDMKPAARFTGDPLDTPKVDFDSNDGSDVMILAWRPDEDFHDNGFEFHDGWVSVPVGGHYLVYSFVDFYEEFGQNETRNENEECDITHSIYRFNILKREERLISNIQPCQMQYERTFNVYSSYVSLLVELRAGDEVAIKVNRPVLIQFTKYNVFGVTMI